MNIQHKTENILNRLDILSPWAFTGVLYIMRWIVIIPLSFILAQLSTSPQPVEFNGSRLGLFIGFIIISPFFETLIECALPYGVMRMFNIIPHGKRPWTFVCISAGMMALLHFFAWPLAIMPSLATGAFLAYIYGHFAPHSFGYALLHTSVFHAAINIIGWLMIVAYM
jgi:hypothetical protein